MRPSSFRWKRPLRALGVDFGSSAVKVVALAWDGERLSLLGAGREALPPGVVEGGVVREPDGAGEVLGRLLARLRVRCRQASLAIGGSSLFWKRIPAPPGLSASDPGFRDAVAREAARHVPFHLESLEFDYGTVPPASGEPTGGEVVFGAAPRETLWAHCEAVRRAGREAVQIELEPCALFEAVRLAASSGDLAAGSDSPGGPLAIVELGASRAAVHVFPRPPARLFEESAPGPTGGSVPPDDPSNELLATVQVPGTGLVGFARPEGVPPPPGEISGGPEEPGNGVFANRVAATLREALGEAGLAPPVRLLLSGGGALVPEIVAPLTGLALGPPERLDPLAAFRAEAEGPLLSVAAGLAAQRLALARRERPGPA